MGEPAAAKDEPVVFVPAGGPGGARGSEAPAAVSFVGADLPREGEAPAEPPIVGADVSREGEALAEPPIVYPYGPAWALQGPPPPAGGFQRPSPFALAEDPSSHTPIPPHPHTPRSRRRKRKAASPFAKGRARPRPVDWALLRSLAGFELALCLRGGGWSRLLAGSAIPAFALMVAPILWTVRYGDPTVAIGPQWTWTLGVLLQGFYFSVALLVMRRRIRAELQPGRVEEILITGAGMREAFLGKALAITITACLLTIAGLPGLILLVAASAHDPATALRLLAVLAPAALLGTAVGQDSVLPRGGLGYLQAAAAVVVCVAGLGMLTLLPSPQALSGLGVSPIVVAVLDPLQAAAVAFARFLLHLAHLANPLAALFDAWDPQGGHWLVRAAALWATVCLVWWRNSTRFDEQDVPALATTARLLEFRMVEFDPRPFRRWRVGFIWVQDLAFGVPADMIPLSVTAERPVPDFSRGNPVRAFDAVFGSRVFIRSDYLFMLCAPAVLAWALGLVSGAVCVIEHWDLSSARFFVLLAAIGQSAILVGRMCYGMAASLTNDREKGRWPFLCLTPLTDREILLGKAMAVLHADRRMLLVAGLLPALPVGIGILPLQVGLLLSAMAVVLPGASLFIGALLAVTAGSQGEAAFRCTLALFGPVLLVVLFGAVGLLRGWAHLLSPFTAMALAVMQPGNARAVALAWGAVGVSCALAAAGAWLTTRALRPRLGAVFGAR